MSKFVSFIVFIVIAAVFFLVTSELRTQPVRDRILGEVELVDEGECTVIRVGFNIPVRYVKHFPLDSGDELRAQLSPIQINPADRDALFNRESVRVGSDNSAALNEVIYEGDMEGGPFLTLMFKRPMAYKVSQGSDYRSLKIVVSEPEISLQCFPEPRD